MCGHLYRGHPTPNPSMTQFVTHMKSSMKNILKMTHGKHKRYENDAAIL